MGENGYLSFDALMGAPDARAVERDVTIDGLGVMRVRALSLHEYWKLQSSAREKGSFDNERWQALVLQHGMVKPVLSYDDAWRLGDKAYGLVAILVDAIVGLTMDTPLGAITQEVVDEAEASFRQ
jgi:hypothetical protein